MFMEIDAPPGPPPMAEGAYWLLTPIAIAFATPPLTGLIAAHVDQTFAPPVAAALDAFRAPLTLSTDAILSAAASAAQLLPEQWVQALKGAVITNDWVLFSFAGGAFTASWIAAGLQRAYGVITGATVALSLALILGVSLLGFCILALTYLFYWAGGLPVFEGRNEAAVLIPLLFPLVLAALFLTANTLL